MNMLKKQSFVLYPKPHTKSEVLKPLSRTQTFFKNFPLGNEEEIRCPDCGYVVDIEDIVCPVCSKRIVCEQVIY